MDIAKEIEIPLLVALKVVNDIGIKLIIRLEEMKRFTTKTEWQIKESWQQVKIISWKGYFY